MSLRKRFGEALLEVRKERKMTQERFSELLGISVEMLSFIERGKHAPSFDKFEQISERLGMPVSRLFPDEDRQDPESAELN